MDSKKKKKRKIIEIEMLHWCISVDDVDDDDDDDDDDETRILILSILKQCLSLINVDENSIVFCLFVFWFLGKFVFCFFPFLNSIDR